MSSLPPSGGARQRAWSAPSLMRSAFGLVQVRPLRSLPSAPSGQMEMRAHNELAPALAIKGESDLFPMTETGHDILASRLSIPTRYYERMRSEAPALLSYNVNEWLRQESEQGVSRMVRTLDGKARAVLSDKYKRLDNHEFLMTVFPVLLEAGKRDGMTVDVKSSEITERRMYVQLTFEGLEAEFPVNRQGRQVGEVVKAGLVLSLGHIHLM